METHYSVQKNYVRKELNYARKKLYHKFIRDNKEEKHLLLCCYVVMLSKVISLLLISVKTQQ